MHLHVYTNKYALEYVTYVSNNNWNWRWNHLQRDGNCERGSVSEFWFIVNIFTSYRIYKICEHYKEWVDRIWGIWIMFL